MSRKTKNAKATKANSNVTNSTGVIRMYGDHINFGPVDLYTYEDAVILRITHRDVRNDILRTLVRDMVFRLYAGSPGGHITIEGAQCLLRALVSDYQASGGVALLQSPGHGLYTFNGEACYIDSLRKVSIVEISGRRIGFLRCVLSGFMWSLYGAHFSSLDMFHVLEQLAMIVEGLTLEIPERSLKPSARLMGAEAVMYPEK